MSAADRTFDKVGQEFWAFLSRPNSYRKKQPPDFRQPDLSYSQFRRSLKTFLCGQRNRKFNCAG